MTVSGSSHGQPIHDQGPLKQVKTFNKFDFKLILNFTIIYIVIYAYDLLYSTISLQPNLTCPWLNSHLVKATYSH